jgi:hypothetical protein
MAKTIHQGYYLAAGGSTATLHSAAGRLIAVLVSHAQATVQTVIFYDNTAASGTVILSLYVDPTNCPYYLELPRDQAIPFSTGLHINQGNCAVSVWSVDHG